MERVTLVGAEDVRHAASSIYEASVEMRNAASWMTEAQQQHQRFLDNWLARFEAALRGKEEKS